MAYYAISDLHGCYSLYRKMLERISFSDNDTLYILGDLVDRGDEGLRIALDVSERENVIGIMGNHDYVSLCILRSLDRGLRSGELADMMELVDAWKLDGGKATYREYRALDPHERSIALGVLDSFRNYAVVNTSGREFVLCHGGIANYVADKPLSDYDISDFAFARENYSKPKFGQPGKFLVTGHTPTASIMGAVDGKIYRNHDHIAIDCGAVFGYGLGCICLDTLEEFYVK